MERSWWAKLVFAVGCVIAAALTVYPTLSGMDVEKSHFFYKKKINLGLDLQGGLYMVMGVDFNRLYREVVTRQASHLDERFKEKKIAVKSVHYLDDAKYKDDPRLVVEVDKATHDLAKDIIKNEYPNLRLTDDLADRLEAALANTYRAEVREKTLNQSIEVIRNRIDEFGVAEPSISSQGSDRLVVELPGIKEVERAKELIGRTAKLEFKIVDDETLPAGKLFQMIADAEKEKNIHYKDGDKFSEYVEKINEALKGKIPADRVVAFEKVTGMDHTVTDRRPYLLKAKTEVTGDELQDAQVQSDPETNRPDVGFTFNPRGANLFDKLTGENVGHRLAIVLDNTVFSAPVIQSRIGARGRITLGQGGYDQVMREARDLAIVLRAGALPAQLEFLEQRVVGPSLGADSIRSGARAGVIGCILVFVFMILYYRVSGMVAALSLLLNGLFTLAVLIGMDATLTLPGIAGIALTIGMAVDSNVIIFERIRDELTEGKSVAAAVQAGFQKAFSAIFDANITHGIIAVILMTYGTGPIRGFAVTLLIGIITTLFCAITVCKLFFDGYLGMVKGPIKKLSI
ncbi:MAG TPA: protein translocase subunit SecD [Bdellovibrionota bacterium]|jgi:protein-export membrane protein SecD|nr:protein translocase subunit SecD [Bdellovibrionota bacterium]